MLFSSSCGELQPSASSTASSTCIHAYMHTCINAFIHSCIHAYMHTCIHAYLQHPTLTISRKWGCDEVKMWRSRSRSTIRGSTINIICTDLQPHHILLVFLIIFFCSFSKASFFSSSSSFLVIVSFASSKFPYNILHWWCQSLWMNVI